MEKYIGDITIFTVIYVSTFVPCWIAVYKIIHFLSKKNLGKVFVWLIILYILLALPYLFVLNKVQEYSWQLIIAMALIPLYSVFRLILYQKHGNDTKLWNWYANHYDVLLHFTPYTSLINHIGNEVLKNNSSGRVLEIGVGTGNIINLLARNPNFKITALDSSEVMIRIAKNKLAGKDITFVRQDLNGNWSHSITGMYDIIIVNNVLYALNDYRAILGQLIRKLDHRGTVYISEPLIGSSTGKLFSKFIRHLSVGSVTNVLTHIFPFIGLMIANFMISLKESVRHYKFFTQNEIAEELTLNGLKIIKIERVYEQQNTLTIAQAE